jgi:hypothetical protein
MRGSNQNFNIRYKDVSISVEKANVLYVKAFGLIMGPIKERNPLAKLFPQYMHLAGCCNEHGFMVAKPDCPLELTGMNSHPSVIQIEKINNFLEYIAIVNPMQEYRNEYLAPYIPSEWNDSKIIYPQLDNNTIVNGIFLALHELCTVRELSKIAIISIGNRHNVKTPMIYGVKKFIASGKGKLEEIIFCDRDDPNPFARRFHLFRDKKYESI